MIRRRQACIVVGAALGLLIGLGGCAPLDRSVSEAELMGSGTWRLVDGLVVPPVAGVAGCGAQALATVLAGQDPRLDPDTLARTLPGRDVGATPVDLLLAARGRGFEATIHAGTWDDLAAGVDDRTPPLVMFDAAPEVPTLTGGIPTSPVMHWGVVSGIAKDGTAVLLAAERARHHVVSRDDFMARWEASDRCLIRVRAVDRRAE